MSNYVLDKSYRVANANGIGAGLAVVRTANVGECDLPAGANAAAVLGITTHSQTRQNSYIGVRRLGIVSAVAAGAIAAGAEVVAADDIGRITQATPPAYNFGVVGNDNAVQIDWIDRASFSLNTEIALVDLGADQTFEWDADAGLLRLYLTTNSGDTITMTAAELIEAINGDADLSKIIRASNYSTSDGSGTLTAEQADATSPSAGTNVIGVAEQAAIQAGDIIDVFLTL